MNKKLLSIFSAILIILTAITISGCAKSSSKKEGTSQKKPKTSTTSKNNVKIKNFAFEPSEIRIKKGKTVIWTNEDSANHTVTSDSGNEINSESLSNSQTYSHTFKDTGTFEYSCSIHPSMKAKVIVE